MWWTNSEMSTLYIISQQLNAKVDLFRRLPRISSLAMYFDKVRVIASSNSSYSFFLFCKDIHS